MFLFGENDPWLVIHWKSAYPFLMSLIIKDGIAQWDIHTSDESQRGMADNKEDGKPVCASNANSTSPRKQGWKEEENYRGRNAYQRQDLSCTGLISSSSAAPNQFQSAPRWFLYLYMYISLPYDSNYLCKAVKGIASTTLTQTLKQARFAFPL